ncbi:MAG: transcriptional repressor [Lachnospiraceae bacterium]|nr:transcriptional repressor [Lachnospiraceae bacterium]
MATTRYSKQREAIKEYLLSTTSHPTAETVYTHIQEQFPNISLGTVYRNLNFLVEHGEAQRLEMGDEHDHYDGNAAPHNHFYCRHCHRVSDLQMDSIDHIDLIANAGFDGLIEGHTIYFTGLCPNCINQTTKQ